MVSGCSNLEPNYNVATITDNTPSFVQVWNHGQVPNGTHLFGIFLRQSFILSPLTTSNMLTLDIATSFCPRLHGHRHGTQDA